MEESLPSQNGDNLIITGSLEGLKIQMGQKNLMDKVGIRGLVKLVMQSSEFPKSIITIPYALFLWKSMLRESSTLEEFKLEHIRKYESSSLYRRFRPSYRKGKEILAREYEIE